jgi:hypothetical protein
VYLLLCDRKIVAEQIAHALPEVDGRGYLEKVIQVEFDLPRIDRKHIQNALFEGLNRLMADPAVAKTYNQTRWGNVYYGGIQPYFETLRQVNRFLSGLSWSVSLFKNGGAFEVNAVDLIALEGFASLSLTSMRGCRKTRHF